MVGDLPMVRQSRLQDDRHDTETVCPICFGVPELKIFDRTSTPDKSMAWLCQKSGTKQAMNIDYARVSTEDQNPDLHLAALKRVGCERIFIEKATGAHVKRPELSKCLKALGEGDTFTVWKLDRLDRSLCDLIGLLDDLKVRGVAFN